ncbi:MAG: sigma-70 family RNA polymerase sigma factor [Clostridiales bacterium]|nr:sigma-70 family RNA polymerase sigma factor [Clostridiales bacterium]
MALPQKQILFIEDCYRLYEQKMYRVAYSILHDESLAEDAVQDAFLKLIRHKVHFDNADSDDCKRYIITVIRNASINIYNKRKSENKIVSFSDNLEKISDAAEPDLESIQDTGAECTPLMNKLPDKYYDVVDCLVIHEYSVSETAGKLGITEANVRKRYERAKKMMRKNLGQI